MSHPYDHRDSGIRWYYILIFVLKVLAASGIYIQPRNKLTSRDDLMEGSKSLAIKNGCIRLIEKIRQGKRFTVKDSAFLSHLCLNSNTKDCGLNIITLEDGFCSVLDEAFLKGLVSDSKIVKSSFLKGIEILKSISKTFHQNVVSVIGTVAGLKDEYNTINSGFTRDFPGFMSFNINCTPEIVGEQIAHEATHLLLENKLFFDREFKNKLSKVPPIYSVFAKKPRTFEYLVHGIFSYTTVYLFWRKLEKKNTIFKAKAKERIKSVKKHLCHALKSVLHVKNKTYFRYLNSIYKQITSMHALSVWQNLIKHFDKVQRPIPSTVLSNHFGNIETAEILLAIEGQKVSRLSKSVNKLSQITNLLDELPLHYCFSPFLFESTKDERIENFKNQITKLHDLDSTKSIDKFIHIYISKNRKNLLNAYVLDQKDSAGTLLGIPECCQKFFNNNWRHAVRYFNGDMARITYGSKKFKVSQDLIYSPLSMYFDYGFCWHFPCKPNCKATRRVINNRIKVMRRYPIQFEKLMAIKEMTVSFKPGRGYRLEG